MHTPFLARETNHTTLLLLCSQTSTTGQQKTTKQRKKEKERERTEPTAISLQLRCERERERAFAKELSIAHLQAKEKSPFVQIEKREHTHKKKILKTDITGWFVSIESGGGGCVCFVPGQKMEEQRCEATEQGYGISFFMTISKGHTRIPSWQEKTERSALVAVGPHRHPFSHG